jgi:hypothetical protein
MVTDRRIRTTAGQDEESAYHILPHNLEAEQGLLGALMLDNRALERVSDVLRPSHFYVPVHQRLYEAIVKLAERGQMAGPVTLLTGPAEPHRRGSPPPQLLSRSCPVIVIHKNRRAYYTAHHPQKMHKR